MNKILDVVEDIKQNITDNQYKILMESLMKINNTNKLSLLTSNYKLNKMIYLSNWLDSKLKKLTMNMLVLRKRIYKSML